MKSTLSQTVTKCTTIHLNFSEICAKELQQQTQPSLATFQSDANRKHHQEPAESKRHHENDRAEVCKEHLRSDVTIQCMLKLCQILSIFGWLSLQTIDTVNRWASGTR